jgi:hypothetical protein
MDEIRMLYYLNEQLGKDAKVNDGEVTDLESALPDKSQDELDTSPKPQK